MNVERHSEAGKSSSAPILQQLGVICGVSALAAGRPQCCGPLRRGAESDC